MSTSSTESSVPLRIRNARTLILRRPRIHILDSHAHHRPPKPGALKPRNAEDGSQALQIMAKNMETTTVEWSYIGAIYG